MRVNMIIREVMRRSKVQLRKSGEFRIVLNDNSKTEVIVGNPNFTYNKGTVRCEGVQIDDSGMTKYVGYDVHPDSVVSKKL